MRYSLSCCGIGTCFFPLKRILPLAITWRAKRRAIEGPEFCKYENVNRMKGERRKCLTDTVTEALLVGRALKSSSAELIASLGRNLEVFFRP